MTPAAREAGPDDVRPASVDVVPDAARRELDRIRRRWAELPLGQAEDRMPLLRQLLVDLAPRTLPRLIANHPPSGAAPRGPEVGGSQEVGEVVVPDLGAAVVVDQVTVLVWDAYAAGLGDGIPELLTQARRALS